MEYELFMSEWFRTTWITRKRMIHEQLLDLQEAPIRLDLTLAEHASLQGQELMRHRLWANRGGYDW